ncbi:hypothetical protein ArsFIN_11590 [Arsenophonus nasoniae]|uniref:Uncharacterized protein n=1 Tax=Arsenophonus nasoniae TaxID=638 RepID=A0A4P7KRL4_9GAMM|nr:hypothetical protein ArsFIN_11590 [Arsenophonus nasoniae]
MAGLGSDSGAMTGLPSARSISASSFAQRLGLSVNDHRKLIHFLSKSDQSKLIHCFTQLLLLSAAYLSIGSFHRLIAVHANDEVNDQA